MSFNNFHESGFGHLAATDINQCAYHGTDHITEKTVGAYNKYVSAVAYIHPLRARNPAQIGFVVGM